MLEWLHVISPGDRVAALVLVLTASAGTVIAVTTVLAVQWRKFRQFELEATLKQGLSVEGNKEVIRESSHA